MHTILRDIWWSVCLNVTEPPHNSPLTVRSHSRPQSPCLLSRDWLSCAKEKSSGSRMCSLSKTSFSRNVGCAYSINPGGTGTNAILLRRCLKLRMMIGRSWPHDDPNLTESINNCRRADTTHFKCGAAPQISYFKVLKYRKNISLSIGSFRPQWSRATKNVLFALWCFKRRYKPLVVIFFVETALSWGTYFSHLHSRNVLTLNRWCPQPNSSSFLFSWKLSSRDALYFHEGFVRPIDC